MHDTGPTLPTIVMGGIDEARTTAHQRRLLQIGEGLGTKFDCLSDLVGEMLG